MQNYFKQKCLKGLFGDNAKRTVWNIICQHPSTLNCPYGHNLHWQRLDDVSVNTVCSPSSLNSFRNQSIIGFFYTIL